MRRQLVIGGPFPPCESFPAELQYVVWTIILRI